MSEHISEREPAGESASSREELKDLVDQQIKAERNSEKPHESKERSIESAREKIRASAERPVDKEKKSEPKPTKRRRLVSRSERTAAYKSALHDVQQQLPPLQRSFSRVVHARFVEEASEFLEETVYRPSFLISGSVGALLTGLLFYSVALTQGWRLNGSELIFGLVVGGILGWASEWLVSRRRQSR